MPAIALGLAPIAAFISWIRRLIGFRRAGGVAVDEAMQRLAAIVESSDDAIIGKTLDGIITSWNDGACRIYGYDAGEAVGRPIAMLAPPDRADEIGEILERIRRGERVLPFETERVTRDGRRIAVSIAVSPIRDRLGRIVGASTIARDITRAKEVEAALKRQPEELTERVKELICLYAVSSALHEGSDRLDGAFQRVVELIPSGWQYPELAYARLTIDGREYRAGPGRLSSWRMQSPIEVDGRSVGQIEVGYAEGVAFDRWPFLESESTLLDTIADRIGETLVRARAERTQRVIAAASAAIARSLDQQVTLRNTARVMVAQLADFCVIDLVDGGRELRREVALARDPEGAALARELERLSPEMAESVPAAVLNTGRPVLVAEVTDAWLSETLTRSPHELEVLRRIGPESIVAVPMTARGELLGVMTLLTAGSGRRYDENDVALASEVAHRAALALENARLYEASLAANQAKSDFLAVISHELRTPLNAIIGYADLLEAGIPDRLTPAQDRHVGRIQASARHLLRLIDDILSFSRLETGREEVRREVAELTELVREVEGMIRPLARDKGLGFRVSLPPAPIWLDTDPPKVRQILLNLLSNAVKFTDEGEIELIGRFDGDTLELHVRDTGIGIAAEDLPRIFDPFWQAEQGRTRRTGGTGIGLGVSRHLARLLGGDVTVESRPGRGSTFTLRLPTDRIGGATPSGGAN